MTRERACLACQGTGRMGACHASCCGESHSVACNLYGCPVCLGTGRVVDAITAQDAECDAETLRRMVTLWDSRGYSLPLARRSPILRASKYGSDASFFMRTVHAPEDEPGQFAIAAARAAFRAVPALREE